MATSLLTKLIRLGSGGPLLKNSSGVVQARNAADGAYAKIQGATATSGNDLVTYAQSTSLLNATLPSASVDGEAVVFSGTDGHVLARSALTGLLKGTAGVVSAAASKTDYQPGFTPTAIKTGAWTAVSGTKVLVDATSAGFQIDLPASPADKDRVMICSVSASTNIITVAGNGHNIKGAATYTLARPYFSAMFEYDATATSTQWHLLGPLGQLSDDLQIKDSNFPGTLVDSELLVASGTTGKALKRVNTMTGIPKLTSGVVAVSNVTDDAQIKASNFPSSVTSGAVCVFSGTGGKTVAAMTPALFATGASHTVDELITILQSLLILRQS
jgi:hypothetical protein